jgi:hypothetical protein
MNPKNSSLSASPPSRPPFHTTSHARHHARERPRELFFLDQFCCCNCSHSCSLHTCECESTNTEIETTKNRREILLVFVQNWIFLFIIFLFFRDLLCRVTFFFSQLRNACSEEAVCYGFCKVKGKKVENEVIWELGFEFEDYWEI